MSENTFLFYLPMIMAIIGAILIILGAYFLGNKNQIQNQTNTKPTRA
jgi:hypothetical protein